MWEIDFAAQIFSFLESILLGGIYGIIYDLFHAPFRKRGAVAFFVCDLVFFVFIAFVNFCFLLGASGGEIRGYLLIGAAAGAFAYKKTLSPLLSVIAVFIFKPIRSVFTLIKKAVSVFSDRIYGFFSKNAVKIAQNIKKLLKKG